MGSQEQDDTASYAFRLFAPTKPPVKRSKAPTTSAADPLAFQYIILAPNVTSPDTSASKANHQRPPHSRPSHHYFAHPTPTQRARYRAAAVEAEAVRAWASRPCWGLRCEWRVVRLDTGSDAAARRFERCGVAATGVRREGLVRRSGNDTQRSERRLDLSAAGVENAQSDQETAGDTRASPRKHRIRSGKKTRIKLRIRLRARAAEEVAAAEEAKAKAEDERIRLEEEGQAYARKEEALREKRRVSNRRKQVKKRERGKAKQLGKMGENEGDIMMESG